VIFRAPGWRRAVITGVTVLIILLGVVVSQLPSWAAEGLLHPARRHVRDDPPSNCENTTFAGAGVTLRGWYCHADGDRRGTIVYLHGIADNRTSAAGIAARYLARGFDVVAYDSRSHGESDGDFCTYGYFEKQDLHRVLDVIEQREPRGIVLFGTSLGAAVALQEAAEDSRVAVVVAVETFSDLRTIARERAPFFLSASTIRTAFSLAGQRGQFRGEQCQPR
jgi:alpha-beta hydrolase superfamily lysophospholipase